MFASIRKYEDSMNTSSWADSLPSIGLVRPVDVIQVSAGLLASRRRAVVRVIRRMSAVVAPRTPRGVGVPLRRVIAVARRREPVLGIAALRSALCRRRRVHHLITSRRDGQLDQVEDEKCVQSDTIPMNESETYGMK